MTAEDKKREQLKAKADRRRTPAPNQAKDDTIARPKIEGQDK